MEKSNSFQNLGLIPLCIAINLSIGVIVKALNFPLYMDSIGTIIATILLGYRAGMSVGIIGFILMTALGLSPFAIYFVGTQIAIALFIHFLSKRMYFKTLFKVILTGILTGIIAAIVSAPVIVLVFEGATGNGSALITGLFVKMGNQIIKAVLFSGLSIEPIDKVIQCVLAFIVLKNIPKRTLLKYTSGTAHQNFISNEN